MKLRVLMGIVSIVYLLSACVSQPSTTQPLPTLIRFPSLTPTISASSLPSPTMTVSPTRTPIPTASVTNTATATITNTPVIAEVSSARTQPAQQQLPTASQPVGPTATLLPTTFVFGQSVEGRDLLAHRHGTGDAAVLVVGGIHAGFEANTVTLVSELHEYFQNRPQRIASGTTLILVPSLNPDGLARGRRLAGRFNANDVDLNRNWGCGWSAEAVFGDEPVDPGSQPFSEPETIALGSLIQRLNPRAVIFYHAAANGVFGGNCGEKSADSTTLAQIYGEASGYPYNQEFSEYTVTGSAPAWVASQGIPALDVELATSEQAEVERNLRALIAVLDWVVEGQD